MALTFVDYTGDGNNDKTFSFPSYQESDVKVQVDNVLKTTTTHYIIKDYSTTGGGTVEFTSGNIPAAGVSIRIYRDTDVSTTGGEYEPKATYVAGSSVKATDLNNNSKQALYAIKEEKEQTITTNRIKDQAVTRAKIYPDAIDGTKIADDSIDSEHYVAASIDNEHLADDAVGADELAANAVVNDSVQANAAIEFTKLENLDSGKILVGNGSNKATETAMSGDVTIDNTGATTITADAVQIGNISDTETTLTANSDAKIPTSKAVADHVVDVVNSIGGFVIVQDKDNFPASHPDPNNDAGTVLSITNPNGLTVSSNTSSNGTRTGGSSTVTINGIPTSAGSPLTANYTMLVQTTTTEHTYDFYKFLAKDGDVLSLSNDMNDFAARYRVNPGTSGLTDNDAGDLVFDTNANKMKVYDGSEWGEVTSTGDFKYIAIAAAGGGAPTYGSATSFDLKEGSIGGSAASITSAAQLIVSVNGVIQKPNSGTSAPAEGFAMADSDTIIFSSAPPADSDIFAVQIGAATDLQVPADNTVTAAKLDLSIVQGDLIYGTGDDTWAKLAPGAAGKVLKMNSGGTAPEWADDTDTTIGGATGADFNDGVKLRFGTGNDMEIVGNANNSGSISNAAGAIGISVGASPYQVTLSGWNTSGTPANNLTVVANSGANTYADLRFDGNVKLATTNTGISVTGGVATDGASTFDDDVTFTTGTTNVNLVWDKSDSSLVFNDNVKAKFGDSGDLAIYHDGINSYLAHESGTGDLILNTDSTCRINPNGGGEYGLAVHTNGAVELYYDNTKEFETKSGGVKLLGHSEQFVTALNPAATITIDFTVGNHFSLAIDQATTFANPSTESVGQSGTITITQPNSGGPYTASWGDQYLWAGGGTPPTLSTAANAVDRIDYVVVATDKIHCVASLDVQ